MRVSSAVRSTLEAIVFLAVLVHVSLDFFGHDAEAPSHSDLYALSTMTPPPEVSTPAPPAPSVRTHPSPAWARVHPTVDASVLANNTFAVCGTTRALTDPWVVGNSSTIQALVFQGTSFGCVGNPVLLQPNTSSTTLAGIRVASGSWLSLQNVQSPSLAGSAGALVMDANSHLEAVVPATYVPNPYLTQTFQLLSTLGTCPSLGAVNATVSNCPADASLMSVGSYVCALASVVNGTNCAFSLTIFGALAYQATNYLQLSMNKDCSSLTQASFKLTIYTATGVPVAAVVVTYWQCSSVLAVMTVLGGSTAQANAALMLVYNSALNGQLKTLLGVTSAILITTPTPTTSAYGYYSSYSYDYSTSWTSTSSSNPALYALFVLLIIPIAIIIGVLLWLYMRKRQPEPCPMPKPCCMPATALPLYAAPMGAPICPSVSAVSMGLPPSVVAAPLSPLTPPMMHCISPVRAVSPGFEMGEPVLGC